MQLSSMNVIEIFNGNNSQYKIFTRKILQNIPFRVQKECAEFFAYKKYMGSDIKVPDGTSPMENSFKYKLLINQYYIPYFYFMVDLITNHLNILQSFG